MKKEEKLKISVNAYKFAQKYHHNISNIERAVLQDMLKDFAISQVKNLQQNQTKEISDDEIRKESTKLSHDSLEQDCFYIGAVWMRNQLKQNRY